MKFQLFTSGSVQRIYINDLHCLEGTDEKAYIKPLPKKQRTGDNHEVGVELIVTVERLRPAIESALKEYGMMPAGIIETGCFSTYKTIAMDHHVSGGSPIKGPSLSGQLAETALQAPTAGSADEAASTLGAFAQQFSQHVLPRGIQGMASAETAVEWAQHFAAHRDSGGRLEDVIQTDACPMRLGLMPALDSSDLATPAFAQSVSSKDLLAGRRCMIAAINDLTLLEHEQLIAWPGVHHDEGRALIAPPETLGELRRLLYCLCAHHMVVPVDGDMDFIVLFNFGQITNRKPALDPSGLPFNPRQSSYHQDRGAKATPSLRVNNEPIPQNALCSALAQNMAMPSPFEPTELHVRTV